jgi:thiol-disulfide isomerase/thioredoxin
MNRRGWVLASAGLAALAAGVAGSAWHQRRQRERAAALAESTGGFWDLAFPQPDGTELATRALLGKPLVLNFWATWCPPCVKEMPEIDRFARDHAARGWQVLGVAIDSPTPVREFLKKTPVTYRIALAGLEGTELVRRMGNPLGGLPFTLALASDGFIAKTRLGETNYAELAAWAAEIR